MLTFADYEKAILADYKTKRDNGSLSLVCMNPTPAALRDECLAICRNRYNRGDARALWTFFGQGTDQATFLKLIFEFKTAKFKPLVNYLRGGTKSPVSKNLELLAWLIDFQPRPLDRFVKEWAVPAAPAGRQQGITAESAAGHLVEQAEIKDEPDPQLNEPVKQAFNFNLGKAAVVITILTILVVAIRYYATSPNKSPDPISPISSGKEACMFWTGDHYQQISCAQNPGRTPIVALDSEKLNHFKKITNWDSITPGSIKSIWYFKSQGELELYTSPGLYPTDQRFRLLPLSKHMYEKYVVPKQHHPIATN